MTAWSNNLNGIASGTTVTTANSGGVSGTAFSSVAAPASTGTITAQAAAAFEGATGLQIVVTTTGFQSGGVSWTTSTAVGTRVSASFWYRFASTPAADATIFSLKDMTLRLSSSPARAIAAYGPGNSLIGTSTAVPTGTWVFIQVAWTPQSTSTSRLECKITGTAGTNYLTLNSATVAAGAAIDQVGFGQMGVASGVVNTHSYDLLAADNTLAVGQFPGPATPSAFSGGMKVWNGTGWVIKPVKVWTGTAWVAKPVKRWNGTAWVLTP